MNHCCNLVLSLKLRVEIRFTFASVYTPLLIFALCQIDAAVSGVCLEYGLRLYTGQCTGGGAADLR